MMTSSLTFVLAAAIKSYLPAVTVERSMLVSHDIIGVVQTAFEEKSIKNIAGSNIAIALLSGAIVGESGIREDIETCKVTGDRGRSIGLGQVMNGPNWMGYTRREICSDRKIQLKIALHALDTCAKGMKDSASVFRCYTTGDRRKDSYVARYENRVSNEIDASIFLSDYIDQVRRGMLQQYIRQYPSRSSVIFF